MPLQNANRTDEDSISDDGGVDNYDTDDEEDLIGTVLEDSDSDDEHVISTVSRSARIVKRNPRYFE